jgi:serine/threonine-protein kinase ULK2
MASSRDAIPQGVRKPRRTTVGQFVIEKEIGKGSFAQVYQGLHKVYSTAPTEVLSLLILPGH